MGSMEVGTVQHRGRTPGTAPALRCPHPTVGKGLRPGGPGSAGSPTPPPGTAPPAPYTTRSRICSAAGWWLPAAPSRGWRWRLEVAGTHDQPPAQPLGLCEPAQGTHPRPRARTPRGGSASAPRCAGRGCPSPRSLPAAPPSLRRTRCPAVPLPAGPGMERPAPALFPSWGQGSWGLGGSWEWGHPQSGTRLRHSASPCGRERSGGAQRGQKCWGWAG